MTLHCWQHWFWITARSPVVVLLLVALPSCLSEDVLVLQQGLHGHGRLVPGVPRVLLLPAMPAAAAATRRLLGYAAVEGHGPGPDPDPDPDPSRGIEYVTTLGTSQASPREAKAIGVFTTTPGTTATSVAPSTAPRTATSVLEIEEPIIAHADASPWTPTDGSAVGSSSTSTASTTESEGVSPSASAEMVNDEPSKAVSPTVDVTPESESEATAQSPSSEMVASSVSPMNHSGPTGATTRVQAMSLGTTPSVVSSVGGFTAARASQSPPGAPASITAIMPSAASSAPAAPAAPPSVATTKAASAASLPTPPRTPNGTASAEPATIQRSSAAVLGHAAKAVNDDKQSTSTQQRTQQAQQLSSGGGLDAGSITGIVLGIVVFAGLIGAISFVMYRRRYLNKPQTLNDKCSNPDSSGYIDDSTLRENSEEMYSLDNDSFLNSLEAMTIQNYWTDTVKHTKL